MPKYFVFSGDLKKEPSMITGENAAHLIRSLRAKPGDSVIVCDGRGTDYDCEITGVSPHDNLVTFAVRQARPAGTEPETAVSLYQALPKGGKMEFIIQKCVEMGVREIIPMVTEHTLAAKEALREAKRLRYEKIAEAAAKQSMRGLIPAIAPVTRFAEALRDSARLDLSFALYENEKHLDLKSLLRGKKEEGKPASAGFFIGPEGGFSPREAAAFREAGVPTVSLGSRILRTETAGLAVLTSIMYEFDEMGVSHLG